MNETKIVVSGKSFEQYRGSLLAIITNEDKYLPFCTDKILKKQLTKMFDTGDFSGKKNELILFYPAVDKRQDSISAKRIVQVGTGNLSTESQPVINEILRGVGGLIAQNAEKTKSEDIAIVLPDFLKAVKGCGAEQIVEGLLLGDYRFIKYKKTATDKKTFSGIKKITIYCRKDSRVIRRCVNRAQLSSQAALTARDMANEPGNLWTPQHFAAFARKLAKKHSLKCKIYDKSQIARMGMGGIIGVNQGSATPPKLIVLEHTPKKFSKTILLVGKGLTFDSGGISIKPASGMQDMKYDMCGGAAVLASMHSVAQEKPDVRVVAVVPSTDNMSGSKALKPGDIITHYNGITSEVVNTDAEGRLILADALAFGVKKYKPDCVIDLATLTGAVIIGLGHHRTGMMTNNDALAEQLKQSGEYCGEPIWQLPLDEEYTNQIDSDVADIKNTGGKAGGSITAAAYLQKFVDKTPWIHLDIAGTAWDFTKKSYITKGASGVGVRTLIHFIRNWSKTLKF